MTLLAADCIGLVESQACREGSRGALATGRSRTVLLPSVYRSALRGKLQSARLCTTSFGTEAREKKERTPAGMRRRARHDLVVSDAGARAFRWEHSAHKSCTNRQTPWSSTFQVQLLSQLKDVDCKVVFELYFWRPHPGGSPGPLRGASDVRHQDLDEHSLVHLAALIGMSSL